MNDVWVCDACKSINRMRNDRCYGCNGRRVAVRAAVGPDVRVQAAVAERAARGYISSLPFALITAVLILAVAALGFALVVVELGSMPAMRQAFIAALSTGSADPLDAYALEQARLIVPSLVRVILLLVAVVGFGLWLSRVVLNIPALGGGTPSRGPWKAFLYPMIPIVNLVKVPGMIQDAMYRLDPEAGGFFMVLAAWIGLFGSWLVDLVGQWVITGLAMQSLVTAFTIEDAANVVGPMIDQLSVLALVTEAMVAIGAVLLVVIMLRIERRAAARDREIRAAVLGVRGAAVP
jgi:hypothetical protein